jgi:hypothetical protein
MQYEFCKKKDINGNDFIEFTSAITHRKDFLDDFLLALKELNPCLKNASNYYVFNVENEEEIKNKFFETGEIDLVIETIYGKTVLSKHVISNTTLKAEGNLQLLLETSKTLESNYLFTMTPGAVVVDV